MGAGTDSRQREHWEPRLPTVSSSSNEDNDTLHRTPPSAWEEGESTGSPDSLLLPQPVLRTTVALPHSLGLQAKAQAHRCAPTTSFEHGASQVPHTRQACTQAILKDLMRANGRQAHFPQFNMGTSNLCLTQAPIYLLIMLLRSTVMLLPWCQVPEVLHAPIDVSTSIHRPAGTSTSAST